MTLTHDELSHRAAAFVHAHPKAVGFAMSPAEFRLFHASDLQSVPADWYVLRLFDATADLSLERVPGGTTRVSELTDQVAEQYGWQRLGTYERLLWGTAVGGLDDGHMVLRDARTPELRVPVTSGTTSGGKPLALTAMEYVAFDEHGNASVVAERLTGILAKGD